MDVLVHLSKNKIRAFEFKIVYTHTCPSSARKTVVLTCIGKSLSEFGNHIRLKGPRGTRAVLIEVRCS